MFVLYMNGQLVDSDICEIKNEIQDKNPFKNSIENNINVINIYYTIYNNLYC